MDKRGNISSRNMRLFAAIMTLIEALVLTSLAGCAGKKVDYGVDTEVKEQKNASKVSDLRTDKPWVENITVQTKKGDVTLGIDAKILVPDCETMHVVGVEDVKLDTEYKKRFLDAYFGGGEYYYHDLEHYTVDELNSYIDLKSRELNEMNSRDDVDDSTKQELVQQMEQDLSGYRDLLTDAKISYTIASDLQSCDEYAGYKGDTFCEVTFKEHWVNAYVFKLDGKYYGPPSFKEKNYDNVSQTFQEDNLTDSAGADGNECTRSAAESKKIVQDFMGKLGLSNQVERGECDCNWLGFNNGDENWESRRNTLWGYVYSYGTGIDGQVFKDSFDSSECDSMLREDAKDITLGDSIQLTVTDNGIIDVVIEYPVSVTSISGSVEMLSLKNIEQIIKEQLKNNADKYELERNTSFNNMQLTYFRLKDKNETAKYSYVPVWSFSRLVDSQKKNVILVNAIDGTIINSEDVF